MSRTLKIVIAVSVSLNLLLMGLFIGHMVERSMHPRHPWEHAISSLPADKRNYFEDAMHRADEDTRPLHEQLREAHKKAAELLKAEPFDKDAYIKQMQVVHDLHGKIMEHMVATVANIAAKFTPEERAALADMLRRPPPPPPPPGD